MPAVQPDPIDDRTPLMLAVCARPFGQVLDLILNGTEIAQQLLYYEDKARTK